jgi:Protein of unknown function (DUF3306)
MSRRIHVAAALLGLLLAGPVLAKGQSTASQPAARIDINALKAESDFTVFMQKDVPEAVRRAALRKLWTLIELPVSCMELCRQAEPATADATRLAAKLVERR